jgi:hypothetical protein
MPITTQNSSFRDQHGRVFLKNGNIYRAVFINYKPQFDHLMHSGLYEALVNQKLIVPHIKLLDNNMGLEWPDSEIYCVLQPELIQTITYPTEWCFSQIKDAAITTLKIQLLALEYGMILKDASGFNIQFQNGLPVLIDILSFDFIKEGFPWIAYKQFCEHFLNPLILVSKVSPDLRSLYGIGGISLELTNAILPTRSKFSWGIFLHIVLHSKAKTKFTKNKVNQRNPRIFTTAYFKRLTDSLKDTVQSVELEAKTQWSDYYSTDVSKNYLSTKRIVVENCLKGIGRINCLWDVGANDGEFSRLAAKYSAEVISLDSDLSSIEFNYNLIKENSINNLLPLLIDITNPTASVGWNNSERDSFFARSRADTLMMLAIIHHLVIQKGIPFSKIADFAKEKCDNLIVEFVPKDDPKVIILLQNREDVFLDYDLVNFKAIFLQHFEIISEHLIEDSKRVIFHFAKK